MLLAKVSAGRLEAALLPLECLCLAAAGGVGHCATLLRSSSDRLGRLGDLLGHQQLGPGCQQSHGLFPGPYSRISHLFGVWVTRILGHLQELLPKVALWTRVGAGPEGGLVLPKVALWTRVGAGPEGGLVLPKPRGHLLRDELLVGHWVSS